MNFYDTLQLNPGDFKKKIKTTNEKSEKRRLYEIMLLRAILIVMFSIVFIALATTFFGAENSALAVSLFCILLSVRFVDFGYCIRDSIINLGIIFFLLVAAPALTQITNPLFSLLIHFVIFLLILVMSSDQPEMGNGGLYAFSYIFLVGNPVTGDLLTKRFMLASVGFIVCGVIFFYKHKNKNKDVSFVSIVKNFNIRNKKNIWQIQFALGISILLGICQFFGLERMMWAGFACAGVLGCYSSSVDMMSQTKERFYERILGALLGSLVFGVAYTLIPSNFYSLFGPIGGVLLGFCTEYKYKTALNCIGALMLATTFYGLQGSILLRIFNNLLGAMFGYAFAYFYQKINLKKVVA